MSTKALSHSLPSETFELHSHSVTYNPVLVSYCASRRPHNATTAGKNQELNPSSFSPSIHITINVYCDLSMHNILLHAYQEPKYLFAYTENSLYHTSGIKM